MTKALLDTDILSEVLKSKDRSVAARASAYLAAQGRYTFSTITVMEVVKGLSRKGREDAIGEDLAHPIGHDPDGGVLRLLRQAIAPPAGEVRIDHVRLRAQVQLRLDHDDPAPGLTLARIVEAAERTGEPRRGPRVPRPWARRE